MTTMTLWIMRHAESTANTEQTIVSTPGPRALHHVGLTEHGRAQAADSAHHATQHHGITANTHIITSDFARTLETAHIVSAIWGAPAPITDIRLRERNFGTLDESPASGYEQVWRADASHGRIPLPAGVESVASVAERVSQVLRDFWNITHPADCPDPDLVLIAHGDVLQILQAVFTGRPAEEHRSLPHLGNAEIRCLGVCPAPLSPGRR